MTTRTLPRAEWSRLVGTELETVAPLLPEAAEVVIVEADNQLVACWAVYPLIHVEGVWIHPDHRGKGSAARRLLRGMRTTAQRMGARAVSTAACTPEIATLLDKLGAVRLDGAHYALNVEDRCQRP
jgi:N-acetylglutamate synthase-like GNAT family acetyltransferase